MAPQSYSLLVLLLTSSTAALYAHIGAAQTETASDGGNTIAIRRWGQHRGGSRRSAATVNLGNATKSNNTGVLLRWAELPTEYDPSSRFDSGPVIGGNGAFYVGGPSGTLLAYHSNGSRWWTATVGVADILATPAVSDDGIVVIGSDAGVFAFTLGGTPQWTALQGAAVANSPLIDDAADRLYISAVTASDAQNPYNYVWALDLMAGTVLWMQQTRGTTSTPTLSVDGSVLLSVTAGLVMCLSNATGALLWQHDTKTSATPDTPAVDSAGNIYVAVWPASNGQSSLLSLTPGGTVRWVAPINVQATPAVSSDGTSLIYQQYQAGDRTNIVSLVGTNGKIRWISSYYAGLVSSTPIVGFGAVYFLCAESNGKSSTVVALDMSTGVLLWRVATPYAASYYSAAALTADGTLIVRARSADTRHPSLLLTYGGQEDGGGTVTPPPTPSVFPSPGWSSHSPTPSQSLLPPPPPISPSPSSSLMVTLPYVVCGAVALVVIIGVTAWRTAVVRRRRREADAAATDDDDDDAAADALLDRGLSRGGSYVPPYFGGAQGQSLLPAHHQLSSSASLRPFSPLHHGRHGCGDGDVGDDGFGGLGGDGGDGGKFSEFASLSAAAAVVAGGGTPPLPSAPMEPRHEQRRQQRLQRNHYYHAGNGDGGAAFSVAMSAPAMTTVSTVAARGQQVVSGGGFPASNRGEDGRDDEDDDPRAT